VGNRLYERSAELATIDDAVVALRGGRGSAVLIEARAGRGKSALVEYAVAAAHRSGARTLVARARHLESAAPFEVLRRLLGPAVEEAGGPGALTGAARFAAPLFTPGAELAQGFDYGCQWLIARLAEQSPLVLAVDDAHWADAASLRVLLEVQAEISVQPVLLVLASRPVENPDAQRRLATMAAQPDCLVLTPSRLSREAVEAVVTETFGEPATEAFVDDCLKVSGGNAFYLHELLRPYLTDFRADQQTFVEDGSMSLRRTMSWRLSELGPAATALAQAAAVLGDGCSLHLVAELADLDDLVAVEEAARLEAASVFRNGDPVDFLHPLVRSAVEKTLPQVMVGQLHARAATMLRATGASASTVTQHLVAAPAAGDADVARFLVEQGRAALESGSIAVARRVLRRALAEPIPADDRDALLVSLARAEHAYGDLESAREHLGAALGAAERDVRLDAAAELFDVLVNANRYDELGQVHRQVVELRPYGDTDAEVRLRAQLLVNAFMGLEPDLAPLPEELSQIDATKLPTDRDVDRYLRAVAAVYERTMQWGTTDRLLDNLRRAIATLPADAGDYTEWDVRTALIVVTFFSDDRLDEIEAVIDRIAPAVVRLRGATPGYQAELDHRKVMTTMARGEFEDALARVDVAEEYVARHHLTVTFENAHRFARGWIAFERGDFESAARLFGDRIGEDNVYPALGALLGGHPERTVELLEAYDLSTEPGAPVKQLEVELEPHLIASHAFGVLGDRDRAESEAAREVAIRRRYGSQPRLALALRRQAGFVPARAALPLLEEAVALADATPRRPVQVRVLGSYGAALRRSGRVEEARAVLYRVIDDAEQMGMERVRARALDELVKAGGRPRRTRLHGPTSLTDAQRQVAELAASGDTNREIAERLFITIKTVETHLAAVYRKLGIGRREELAPLLVGSAGDREAPALLGRP
jgi:DNA-binding CsgD family transcriptional regulator